MQLKQNSDLNIDQLPKNINERFHIQKRISSGSFGIVYLCFDQESEERVAIKIEKANTQDKTFDKEVQILELLRGLVGVPKLIYHGNDNETGNNIIAMQLLSNDLSYYMRQFKTFSLKCVLNIAKQLILILESIHNRGVIHRDIKPENILTNKENNQLYLVDYGISKIFRDSKNCHLPYRENKPFIGTTRYASISAHKGQELARKDDLESLGYVFVYMLKGQLPWQNLQNVSENNKCKIVGTLKMTIKNEKLCEDLPIEFQRYLDYVKKLSYKTQPDYKYINSLFDKCVTQLSIQDNKFDWNEPFTISTKSTDSNFKEQKKYKRKSQVQQQQFITPPVKPKQQTYIITNRSSLDPAPSSKQHINYLKLPDSGVLQRDQSGRKYSGSFHSIHHSQISSICLNYIPSIFSRGSNKKLSQSKSSFDSGQKISLMSQLDNVFRSSNENFQDLEEFMERSPEKQLREETFTGKEEWKMDDPSPDLYKKYQSLRPINIISKEQLVFDKFHD